MSNTLKSSASRSVPRVALFVTCLADAMRPSVGFAALKLLQQQVSQQAQVLAYNDVFLLIAAAAAVGAVWVAVNHYRPRIEARRAAHREAAQAAAAAAVE